MSSPMAKVGIIFGILAAATIALLVLAIRGQHKVRCEVCVTFRGATACREAAGGTDAEAQRTAHENACAFLASGMTDSIACQNVLPASVKCLAPRDGARVSSPESP